MNETQDISEMPHLTNKTLIITGSSRGIGRALAVGLARQGADLILNARSRVALDQAFLECSEHKGRVQAVAGDISRAETVAECVALTEGEELRAVHLLMTIRFS